MERERKKQILRFLIGIDGPKERLLSSIGAKLNVQAFYYSNENRLLESVVSAEDIVVIIYCSCTGDFFKQLNGKNRILFVGDQSDIAIARRKIGDELFASISSFTVNNKDATRTKEIAAAIFSALNLNSGFKDWNPCQWGAATAKFQANTLNAALENWRFFALTYQIPQSSTQHICRLFATLDEYNLLEALPTFAPEFTTDGILLLVKMYLTWPSPGVSMRLADHLAKSLQQVNFKMTSFQFTNSREAEVSICHDMAIREITEPKTQHIETFVYCFRNIFEPKSDDLTSELTLKRSG